LPGQGGAHHTAERLAVLEAMPATPSGKIREFKLRDMLRDGTL
jgi:acyl-coenzyme A synthetase/AMP-(fatty) acid ligase